MQVKSSNDHFIQSLVKGCIDNEKESQRTMYKHFYSFAMSICLRYASDRLEAAGILNAAFFKVFKNISRYNTAQEFAPWLGKIVSNTAIDHYRSNLKFANQEDLTDHEYIPYQENSIYDKLNYNDLLALVQQLSPAYRAVFNLYAIDGYSHDEIGDLLQISVGTSKSNLFKARQKLQEMLKTINAG